ncbi:hypothetical protein OAE48_00530 [Flavobacteriales bacterium]|nr:hypothetical protein [Flavobacteriales bacterium]
MSFARRFGYFLFGVGLGSLLVYVLLIRDRDFPAWLPEGRVLEELAVDSVIIPESIVLPFADSLLSQRIMACDVLFNQSVVRDQPCKEYQLESDADLMRFEICDDKITLMNYESR